MTNHIGSVLFILAISFIQIFAETGDDVNSLLTDIYTTRAYNSKVRPLIDQTRVLNVAVDFYLSSVIDFDEKTESLKTAGFLSLNWQDEYFVWTPASFNNTEHVFVPQDDIWKPDISLKNSFKSFKGLGSSYLNLVVTYDGWITWNPYQVLESTCAVSITYFPFDVQTCSLKFTAWSYTKSEVEINMGTRGVLLDEYVPNASWEVVETSAEEINTDEAAVVFHIKLKRRPRFYIINIVIPIIFLSILNVFSFVLPVTSGERAGYSITVFLSLAVFLTIVSDQLPNNSENTSLLAVYIMLITGLSTFIVMVCMIQLRLQSWNESRKPVTKFYRFFVNACKFLQCKTCKRKSISPKEEKEEKSKPNLHDDDDGDDVNGVTWLEVIHAMDYVFFTASMLYTFICTVVIGTVAINAEN